MEMLKTNSIQDKFRGRVNSDWSFSDSRSIDFWTHGYHRYPAKFIPPVVEKLLDSYTKPGDKVVDLFAGCGTTLVECKVKGLDSVGVDINPIAQLITNAKINPIKPKTVEDYYEWLKSKLESFDTHYNYVTVTHPRIDYWFGPEEKNKIAYLYSYILKINNTKVRDFFLCALSNILKNCSKWLQDSTKPQIDPQKDPAEPFKALVIQVNKMLKRNKELYEKLKIKR